MGSATPASVRAPGRPGEHRSVWGSSGASRSWGSRGVWCSLQTGSEAALDFDHLNVLFTVH